MATVSGTLDQPVAEAGADTRRVAAEQGWAWAQGESTDDTLVLKKGTSAFSWGSKLIVHLAATAPSTTRLTISTHETFALIDWGRGRRAAQRLLDGIGARTD
jgi:hypothetical protein